MSKKLILVLIAVFFDSQLFSMQASKKLEKLATKAGAISLAGLVYNFTNWQDESWKQEIADLPNYYGTEADELRAKLLSSDLPEVDRDSLRKIQFKSDSQHYETRSHDINGIWTILLRTDKDLEEKIVNSYSKPKVISDFACLREISLLNDRERERSSLRQRCFMAASAGLAFRGCFTSSKLPKWHGFAVNLLPVICGMSQLEDYRSEVRADEFAIQALKAQKNAEALREGHLELLQSTVIPKFNPINPTLDALLNGRRANRAGRALRVEQACRELEDLR